MTATTTAMVLDLTERVAVKLNEDPFVLVFRALLQYVDNQFNNNQKQEVITSDPKEDIEISNEN